ncbi:Lachesin, partial [Frankliniella fusca]
FGQVQPLPNEPEPEFLQPLENHTASQGRNVEFTCIVDHLGPYRVAWIKSDTKAILAIHTHLVAHNQRLGVTHNGHNTWRLHVKDVQPADNGTYMCQINTEPMRSQMGTLLVVVPPDILSNDSSETSGVAREGGSVMLRCTAVGEPEPTVSWRREDQANIVFRHEGGREKQAVRTVSGPVLQLAGVMRQDMGTYLCIATNGIPPSVSKRFQIQVHFEPLIKVSNQLVAAPIYSDVVIQCYVEASPKAMNTWWREGAAIVGGPAGAREMDKLVQGDKYIMQEIQLSDYAVLMNLTIRELSKKDFGGYVCSSVNVLGKAEGNIRLQELHLPASPSTTTSTAAPRHTHRNRNKSTSSNASKTPAHSKDPQGKQQQQQQQQQGQPHQKKKAGEEATSSTEQLGRNTQTTLTWEVTRAPPRRKPDRWNDIPGSAAPLRPGCPALVALAVLLVVPGRR